MDAAGQPRARRRAGHRLRRDGGATASRYILAEARLGGVRARARHGATSSRHASRAAISSAARYTPLFPFFADTPERVPGARRRLRVDRGRHRRRAHGARLRRGRPDRLQRRRHPDDRARWTSTAATRPRSPPWAGVHVFDANPDVIRELKDARRRRAPRHATTTRTRTAGAAPSRSSTGRSVAGSCEVTAFRDRMVELNQQIQLGARARQGRQLRQVAGQRPRLVDQPQPLLGLADPGVAQRRPELPAHRRLRIARRARARLRCRRSTTCTGPCVDDLVRPNPDDPTGRSMMRRVPEVLDCWFESGSMPFAQVHYPFENAEWFEHHYPGRLHRRVHRPRPAAGSTRCTCWPRRCSTARRSGLRQPRHRARRRRPEDVEEPAQLPRPDGDVRHLRRRRDALVPAVVADPARRRPRRSPRRASATRVRQVLLPLWNAWSFLTLYANAAGTPGTCRTDHDRRARPVPPGQDRTSSSRRDGGDGRRTTCSAPAARVRRSSTR